jgi:ribonuclease HI
MKGKEIHAYVDGSYNTVSKKGSYGYIAFDSSNLTKAKFGEVGLVKRHLESRNIAGELLAIQKVVECAQKNGYTKIHIYHDLDGSMRWAKGQWKVKQPVVQEYVDCIIGSCIEIVFHKVKAHSGNVWNTFIDKKIQMLTAPTEAESQAYRNQLKKEQNAIKEAENVIAFAD